jgi:hypothetical protein
MAGTWEAHFSKGLTSGRPAANTLPKGAIYWSTDDKKFFVGSGPANTWADFTAAFAMAADLAGYATEAYADAAAAAAAAALVDAAPGALDTLNELAAALGDDASFASTVTTALAGKASTTHASAHQAGGGDAIKLDDLAAPDDNTDLNVSTSAHGLAPKLPNDATKYLDGTGAYSTPPGSGGGGGALVLLASLTASASASLDFTTRNAAGQSGAIFQSDFDRYVIDLGRVMPATNNVTLYAQFSNDGGSSYPTASYWYAHHYARLGDHNATGNTNQDNLFVTPVGIGVSSPGWGVCASLDMWLGDATFHTRVQGKVTYNAVGADMLVVDGGWLFLASASTNAIRFLFNSGNIASGTIRIYGVTK